MQDIVNFYKTFDRYKPFDSDDIANHIQQSYDNKQYKVFKDVNKNFKKLSIYQRCKN